MLWVPILYLFTDNTLVSLKGKNWDSVFEIANAEQGISNESKQKMG